MKYLKQLKHTLATHFQAWHLLAAWMKWRLVDAELDADAKLDAAEG